MTRILHQNDFSDTCRRFAERLRAALQRGDFANAAATAEIAPPDLESATLGTRLECFANTDQVGPMGADGFMRLAAYGNHPYGAPTEIQEFDRAAAEGLVRVFRVAANALSQALFHTEAYRPVYSGHPDHPDFAARGHDDFTLRAKIVEMQAREDGLYIRPEFTDAGNALLHSGTKLWWSPRWVTELVRREADGRRIWRPYKLLSAGIVPLANIHGSAANAAPPIPEPTLTMKKLLAMLLARLGYTADQANAVAAETDGAPTSDEIDARLQTQLDAANGYWDLMIALMRSLGYSNEEIDGLREEGASAPSIEDLTARLTERLGGAETAQAAADQANATLETERATITRLTADLANERRERATLLVRQAIAERRVSPSDESSEIETLAAAADFANAAQALATRKPLLPGGGRTDHLGRRSSEMQDMANATGAFNTALADFANEKKYDLRDDRGYQRAYGEFKATPRGKELLVAMSKAQG